MLIALSVSASELGVLSLVLLLIYSAAPQDPGHAALSGLYAFAGGLLQTLLSLALWPLRRYRPERRALADLDALINTEADRMTNAVNTLSEEVFRWRVPSGPV